MESINDKQSCEYSAKTTLKLSPNEKTLLPTCSDRDFINDNSDLHFLQKEKSMFNPFYTFQILFQPNNKSIVYCFWIHDFGTLTYLQNILIFFQFQAHLATECISQVQCISLVQCTSLVQSKTLVLWILNRLSGLKIYDF